MIQCHSCEIALPDGTIRCPMCQRNLKIPPGLIVGGILLAFVFLGGLLWASGKIKTKVVNRFQASTEEVLKAAQNLVVQNPAVRNPVGFSALDQTTVEHWDGRRWRVAGYVDTRPAPGVKVRTLYFAVMLNNGQAWGLEDLQLQSMELGKSGGR